MNNKIIIVYDTVTTVVKEYKSVSDFHKEINYQRCNITENFIQNRYICYEKDNLVKNSLRSDCIALPINYVKQITKNIITKEKNKIINKIYDSIFERYIYVYNIENKLMGTFTKLNEVSNFLKIPIGTVKSRMNRSKHSDIYFKDILITYIKK